MRQFSEPPDRPVSDALGSVVYDLVRYLLVILHTECMESLVHSPYLLSRLECLSLNAH